MKCLAIIPARGSSKGIPRKNLRPLAGRPLITHVIDAVQQAELISRIVVTTDDPEIAAVAESAGVESLQRPPEISGDTATSESALLHALDHLAAHENYEPDLVMLVQCTSPLTVAEDLDGAIKTLLERNADSCFTAVPFYHFLWDTNADGSAAGINHSGTKRQRRQDLTPQYLENGAAYVMRTAIFRETGDRFCGRTVLSVVAEERCLEIDTPLDLLKAEAVLRARGVEGLRARLPAKTKALVMDFDGVLTDNGVYLDQDGTETVRCDRGDGLGLDGLRQKGLHLLILSKERNPVVSRRAAKLQLECLQCVDDKAHLIRTWAAEHEIPLQDIVYVGNDANDVAAMQLVGCAACPSDAHSTAKHVASIILSRPGGRGAIRELCDLLSTRL